MAKTNTAQKKTAYIGVDIGGTGIKGGLVDLEKGDLIGERYRIPTPKPSTPEAVAEVVNQIVEHFAAGNDEVRVGVTFPAIIRNGVAKSAANVDKSWIDTDVKAVMEKATGRKVVAVNDADAAGVAEAHYGAGKGKDGLVVLITLGTGIGSAMTLDGKLIPNSELGHLELDGHVAETQASASARERQDISFKKYATKRLQPYFSHVERLFSPDLFIVGGGVSKRSEDFLPLLELDTPIVPAELRNNAGIVGAAVMAKEQLG